MITQIDWISANSVRNYPLEDEADRVDDYGNILPNQLIADLSLWFPKNIGLSAFVSNVLISEKIITISFSANKKRAYQENSDPEFLPLAVIAIKKPVIPGKLYKLTPSQEGVSGYIAFGVQVNELETKIYKFSNPKATTILPKNARACFESGIRAVENIKTGDRLSGIIHFKSSDDEFLAIEKQNKKINNSIKECIVFKIKPKGENGYENFLNLLNLGDGRPSMQTCPYPFLKTINNIRPNCKGQFVLNFTNTSGILENRNKVYAEGRDSKIYITYNKNLKKICKKFPNNFEIDREDLCDDPCRPITIEETKLPSNQKYALAYYYSGPIYDENFEVTEQKNPFIITNTFRIPVKGIPYLKAKCNVGGCVVFLVNKNAKLRYIRKEDLDEFMVESLYTYYIPDFESTVIWKAKKLETMNTKGNRKKVISSNVASGIIPEGNKYDGDKTKGYEFLNYNIKYTIDNNRFIDLNTLKARNFITEVNDIPPHNEIFEYKLIVIPVGKGYANVEFYCETLSDLKTTC